MIGRLRRGGFHFDFVGHGRRWFVISMTLILVSLGSLAIRGLNLGLEFRGGTSFEVEGTRVVESGELRDLVTAAGVQSAVVQRTGQTGYLVQTEHLGADLQSEVAGVVAEAVGGDRREVTVNDVGPRWGRQVSEKALRALVIFLLIATAYISLRFEPKMAGTALVALVHDIVITAGIYSLVGFVVTPATMIAFLTILGYSLYDTVVVFDRVKERTQLASAGTRMTYSDIANESLNQVMVRSLNTSLTSMLPTGSLLFVGSYVLGAATLRELALALFIGMSVGTYSSIFVAVPILARWKEREQRWSTLRARIAVRQAEPAGARVRPASRDAGTEEPGTEPATVGPRSPAKRPRKKGKKRKRR